MAQLKAPGLKWRARKTGQCRPYWIASRQAVRAGYPVKTVPLHFDHTDPAGEALLVQRCFTLQAEMNAWLVNSGQMQSPFDGTIQSLVTRYETDPDSPYKELRKTTQKGYSKHLRLLISAVGDRRLDAVSGADVRRWYKKIATPDGYEGNPRLAYAYTVIGIFKAVVSYGASLGSELSSPNPCLTLRAAMSATRFKQPPARKTALTYAQVAAFRDKAHARGRHSMALGLTLQFELAFRQRDVIGGYENGRWGGGLTWGDIGRDGILRKTTSKTGADAEHRIADHPDLVAELDRIPAEKRVGPLVVDEGHGMPYTPEKYRRWFRLIAREAGIPDNIWSMDARAGAVTEAYEAGATTEDAMSLATHTQVATSRRYRRGSVEQTSRAAKLRIASRTDGE